MCMAVDSSGDIPFLSTDLSFNMIQLPRYRLVLDSTYLEVNGTYVKTKYIVTCPQNILVDLGALRLSTVILVLVLLKFKRTRYGMGRSITKDKFYGK